MTSEVRNANPALAYQLAPKAWRQKLLPHPARGVATVFVGARSRQRLPDGPPVELAMSVPQLEAVLAGLRRLE